MPVPKSGRFTDPWVKKLARGEAVEDNSGDPAKGIPGKFIPLPDKPKQTPWFEKQHGARGRFILKSGEKSALSRTRTLILSVTYKGLLTWYVGYYVGGLQKSKRLGHFCPGQDGHMSINAARTA